MVLRPCCNELQFCLQNSSAKSGNKTLTLTPQTVLQAITQILFKSNNIHVNYLCCRVVHLIQMGSEYLHHSQLGHFLVLTVQGYTGRQVETSIVHYNLQWTWIFFFCPYFIFQGLVTQNMQLFCMADLPFGPGGSLWLYGRPPQKGSFGPLFKKLLLTPILTLNKAFLVIIHALSRQMNKQQ